MSEHLEHKMMPTNGVNLHVVFAGPENGKPVILLHGFPEFWRGWLKQIEPLAHAGYHVIVPDQRGYNLSDKPKGISAYHIDILAQDVIGLIDAVGREKAIVIGHDWGAAVAWHLATRYPRRVEKLGILNVPHPAIMIQTLQTSIAQLRKSWYMFFFQIPRLPEWLLGRNDAQGAAELLRRSSNPGSFTNDDLDEYRNAWTQPGALTAMINWYRSALRSGFGGGGKASQALPRIMVPTLMLWGKQDIALSYEMAQSSIDLCEQGELITYEDATHWVQHDKVDEVNEQLLRFLDSK